jgi:hypothetical protein
MIKWIAANRSQFEILAWDHLAGDDHLAWCGVPGACARSANLSSDWRPYGGAWAACSVLCYSAVQGLNHKVTASEDVMDGRDG